MWNPALHVHAATKRRMLLEQKLVDRLRQDRLEGSRMAIPAYKTRSRTRSFSSVRRQACYIETDSEGSELDDEDFLRSSSFRRRAMRSPRASSVKVYNSQRLRQKAKTLPSSSRSGSSSNRHDSLQPDSSVACPAANISSVRHRSLYEEDVNELSPRHKSGQELRGPSQMQKEQHEHDVSSARRRMDYVLKLYGMKALPVQGDGNCQFRALSQNVFCHQENHAILRMQIIDHLKKHSEHYQDFAAGEPFQQYLKRMSHDGAWGDNLTLQAASNVLGRTIIVFTDQPGLECIEITPWPDFPCKPELLPFYLLFWSEVHYDAACLSTAESQD